ncbi:MAG: glycosyltransferase family 4 protein [Acidimicrobiales bacterium]
MATRTRRILSIQPVAERGGSDQALLSMVRRLGREGWECHVAMPGPSPIASEWSHAGAVVHSVPMRRISGSAGGRHWAAYALAWPAVVARLARLARRLDVDVVHTNSLHSWYGWAAASLARRPHAWHAREIVVQSGAALGLERFLVRHFADQLIAGSVAIASQFPEVPASRLCIVNDEADPDRFNPRHAGSFRTGQEIADDDFLVGAAGRIDTWKGLEVLLDAVPILRGRFCDLTVAVAGLPVRGKEHYARELEEKAAATPGVRWLGSVEEIAGFMADLDVFVLPSTEPEPFGLVVVEALSSGVPVVASAAGGPAEILADQPPTVGRLIPPGDAGALAAAVADLLPAGTSTVARRSRTGVHPGPPPDYASALEAAIRERTAAAWHVTSAFRHR